MEKYLLLLLSYILCSWTCAVPHVVTSNQIVITKDGIFLMIGDTILHADSVHHMQGKFYKAVGIKSVDDDLKISNLNRKFPRSKFVPHVQSSTG